MPLDWSGCGRIHPGPDRRLLNEKPLMDYRSVSNQNLARLKIPLEGGRLVDSRDRFATPLGNVARRILCLHFLPGDPIGEHVRFPPSRSDQTLREGDPSGG
jgi:hypothetical protein